MKTTDIGQYSGSALMAKNENGDLVFLDASAFGTSNASLDFDKEVVLLTETLAINSSGQIFLGTTQGQTMILRFNSPQEGTITYAYGVLPFVAGDNDLAIPPAYQNLGVQFTSGGPANVTFTQLKKESLARNDELVRLNQNVENIIYYTSNIQGDLQGLKNYVEATLEQGWDRTSVIDTVSLYDLLPDQEVSLPQYLNAGRIKISSTANGSFTSTTPVLGTREDRYVEFVGGVDLTIDLIGPLGLVAVRAANYNPHLMDVTITYYTVDGLARREDVKATRATLANIESAINTILDNEYAETSYYIHEITLAEATQGVVIPYQSGREHMVIKNEGTGVIYLFTNTNPGSPRRSLAPGDTLEVWRDNTAWSGVSPVGDLHLSAVIKVRI